MRRLYSHAIVTVAFCKNVVFIVVLNKKAHNMTVIGSFPSTRNTTKVPFFSNTQGSKQNPKRIVKQSLLSKQYQCLEDHLLVNW